MAFSPYGYKRVHATVVVSDVMYPEGSAILSNHTGNDPREDHGDLLLLESKTRVKRPPMFRVIMLNDDYTPMEFVVEVLKTIFHQLHEEAVSVMLTIHHQGSGVCGVYTRDVAETKIDIATEFAREHEYPLQCRMECD